MEEKRKNKRIVSRMPVLPSMPAKKRVAAYARVSMEKEAMLHSLAAQVGYYSDLIRKNSEWEYAGVYPDEGLTGTKENRPQFQQLLTDCRAEKIDMVLVKSISRFARNTVTLLETVRELKKLGIDVYFEEQHIHTISGDGELMLTILASFAQEEAGPFPKTSHGACASGLRTERSACRINGSWATGKARMDCRRLWRKKRRLSARSTSDQVLIQCLMDFLCSIGFYERKLSRISTIWTVCRRF